MGVSCGKDALLVDVHVAFVNAVAAGASNCSRGFGTLDAGGMSDDAQ